MAGFFYSLNGKQVTLSFGVKRYGDREAFERAVAARQQLLGLVADGPFLRSETARKFEARKNPMRA